MTIAQKWDVVQRLGALRKMKQSGRIHPERMGWIENEIRELESVKRAYFGN